MALSLDEQRMSGSNSDSQHSLPLRKQPTAHRFPRVDAVEPGIPASLVNFPHFRERNMGESGRELPSIERGNCPGVPFDQCSLSTVDGMTTPRSHRRRKKYTTTTVTTVTTTKILLPHMQQVVSFGNTQDSLMPNPFDAQKAIMSIEGNNKSIMNEHPDGSIHTESARHIKVMNHSPGRSQPSLSEIMSGTCKLHYSPEKKRLSGSRLRDNNNNNKNNIKMNNTNYNTNNIILPKNGHHVHPEELSPPGDVPCMLTQSRKGPAVVSQQPWLFSQETVGRKDVTRHGSFLPQLVENGSQRPGSHEGRSKLSSNHIENNERAKPLKLQRGEARHSDTNGRAEHESEVPWILNEERKENVWLSLH